MRFKKNDKVQFRTSNDSVRNNAWRTGTVYSVVSTSPSPSYLIQEEGTWTWDGMVALPQVVYDHGAREQTWGVRAVPIPRPTWKAEKILTPGKDWRISLGGGHLESRERA